MFGCGTLDLIGEPSFVTLNATFPQKRSFPQTVLDHWARGHRLCRGPTHLLGYFYLPTVVLFCFLPVGGKSQKENEEKEICEFWHGESAPLGLKW